MTGGCPRTIETGAYLLNGLSKRERADFVRHLDTCPNCRREVADLLPAARLLDQIRAGQHDLLAYDVDT